MTEREMEDLLWDHADKFLNEPLQQFRRQPQSPVGRADLVFTDRLGQILIIELKKGTLPRGAVNQLLDYMGMLKHEFPNKAVELMVVANEIPRERALACEQYNIEHREISEKKFRDIAREVKFAFESEKVTSPSRPAEALVSAAMPRPELPFFEKPARLRSFETSAPLLEECLGILQRIDAGITLNDLGRMPIGLKLDNRAIAKTKFVTFRPKQKFLRIKVHTASRDEWSIRLRSSGLEVVPGPPKDRTNSQFVRFKVYRKEELEMNRDLIASLFRGSYDEDLK